MSRREPCPRCGADIRVIKTALVGGRLVIDADPDPTGTVRVFTIPSTGTVVGEALLAPHPRGRGHRLHDCTRSPAVSDAD